MAIQPVRAERLGTGVYIIPDNKFIVGYQHDDTTEVSNIVIGGESLDFLADAVNPLVPVNTVVTNTSKVSAYRPSRGTENVTIGRGAQFKCDVVLPTGGLGGLSIPLEFERNVTIFTPAAWNALADGLSFPGQLLLFQTGLNALAGQNDGVERLATGDGTVSLLAIDCIWTFVKKFAQLN